MPTGDIISPSTVKHILKIKGCKRCQIYIWHYTINILSKPKFYGMTKLQKSQTLTAANIKGLQYPFLLYANLQKC